MIIQLINQTKKQNLTRDEIQQIIYNIKTLWSLRGTPDFIKFVANLKP